MHTSLFLGYDVRFPARSKLNVSLCGFICSRCDMLLFSFQKHNRSGFWLDSRSWELLINLLQWNKNEIIHTMDRDLQVSYRMHISHDCLFNV